MNKRTWMSNILEVDTLKLTDIVWPCAHNAGMDKKAPNYDVIVGTWTTCQNDSFAFQLANGIRAFDLRLGYREDDGQPVFYFHHRGFESHRRLDELIDAVLAFIDRHEHEFIVLDFHELGDDQPFDSRKLGETLMSRLGSRCVLAMDAWKTIGQLKADSSLRRIVMSAPPLPGVNGSHFWPRIPHKWSGSLFTNADELRRHIGTTLQNLSNEAFLWSLSATGYSLLRGPLPLKDEINDWFNTAGDWVTRCSLINVDFFDESKIVQYCWSASSMKAVALQDS